MKTERYIEIRWHEDRIEKSGKIDWSCGASVRIEISPKGPPPSNEQLREIVESYQRLEAR